MKFSLMGLSAKNNGIPRNINEFSRQFSLNTGNLLFCYAAELITNLTNHKFSWGTDAVKINSHKNTNGLLLPMANQLGNHVDLSVKGPRILGITKPIVALGLGAQFTENVPNKNEGLRKQSTN